MNRESRTVDRSHQVDSSTPRHVPLVDLLVDTRSELMELAVASGLKVLQTMLEDDRTAICGQRYQHQNDRQASRAGTVSSEVVLGGRKVALRRPRVRANGEEVPLPTFQAMASEDPLNRRVVEQMLVGVATRQYARSLEPLPAAMVKSEDRAMVLADMRSIFDGFLRKEFGTTESSREWRGRITFLVAVTSEIDRFYSVIQSLGDRFLMVRWHRADGVEAALTAMNQDMQRAQSELKTSRPLNVGRVARCI